MVDKCPKSIYLLDEIEVYIKHASQISNVTVVQKKKNHNSSCTVGGCASNEGGCVSNVCGCASAMEACDGTIGKLTCHNVVSLWGQTYK